MKLNAVGIIFTLLAFSVFQALIVSSQPEQAEITFPQFNIAPLDFLDLTAGCGDLADCVFFVGKVILNIGIGVINFVLIIFGILVFLAQLFGLMITLSVKVFSLDMPWYVKIILTTPYAVGISLLVFKLLRSGDSNA